MKLALRRSWALQRRVRGCQRFGLKGILVCRRKYAAGSAAKLIDPRKARLRGGTRARRAPVSEYDLSLPWSIRERGYLVSLIQSKFMRRSFGRLSWRGMGKFVLQDRGAPGFSLDGSRQMLWPAARTRSRFHYHQFRLSMERGDHNLLFFFFLESWEARTSPLAPRAIRFQHCWI